METRTLGKDGPEVSVVCFGAWPVGGGLGTVEEDQGIATVRAALDVGMTFIDTAEGYQSSETVVGKAIKGRRGEAFLATKLSGGDHSLEHMKSALEHSLRTLGTDYIDLYQLHSPQPQWPIEQTMEGLLRLRDEGKIRYIGISNYSAEQTLEALQCGPIHSSQPRYNVLCREAEDSVLSCCLQNGIGVIPHSVLCKGMLAGKHRPGHRFATNDERTQFNFFQGALFEEAYGVVEGLQDWAESHGRDGVQLAVAWVLAHPSVTSAIVGAKSPEQVHQNAKGADWRLTESDLKEIDEIMDGFRFTWVKDIE